MSRVQTYRIVILTAMKRILHTTLACTLIGFILLGCSDVLYVLQHADTLQSGQLCSSCGVVECCCKSTDGTCSNLGNGNFSFASNAFQQANCDTETKLPATPLNRDITLAPVIIELRPLDSRELGLTSSPQWYSIDYSRPVFRPPCV